MLVFSQNLTLTFLLCSFRIMKILKRVNLNLKEGKALLIQGISREREGAKVTFKNASANDLVEIEGLGGSITEKKKQTPSDIDFKVEFFEGTATFKNYDEAKRVIETLHNKKTVVRTPSSFLAGTGEQSATGHVAYLNT